MATGGPAAAARSGGRRESLGALVAFVIRRLRGNAPLALSALLGLITTAALITAVPLFAEGFSELLIRQRLRDSREVLESGVLLRHVDTLGGDSRPTSPAQYRQADERFSAALDTFSGLPELHRVHYLQTDKVPLLRAATGPDQTRVPIASGYLAALTGLADQIELLEGHMPSTRIGSLRDVSGQDILLVEVMLTSRALDDVGLVVGDRLTIVFGGRSGRPPVLIALDIVGRFAPRDEGSRYWPFNPATFDRGALFVDPAVYVDGLLARYPQLFRQAAWYANFDESGIRATGYRSLIEALDSLRSLAARTLPDTILETKLDRVLEAFDRQLVVLKLLLFALSAPIVAIVLYFMRLAAGMSLERQRSEIAILKSRGVATRQVIGVYLLEGLLLGSVAIVLGPLLGLGLAQLIGKTQSFLVFTPRENLPLSLRPVHFGFAAVAVVVALGATLGLAVRAARFTVVTHRQTASRPRLRTRAWRLMLEVLFLGLAIFGYLTLRDRQSLPELGPADARFSDVLLVLIPVAFIFSGALLALHAFPWSIRAISWAGSRLYGAGIYLGLRLVGRSPGRYTGLALLLTLTFALGAFSASLAATIDRNIVDRAYYRSGADALFDESGHFDQDTQLWYVPPVDQHFDVLDSGGRPAIQQAARFWSGEGQLQSDALGSRSRVILYAVDPGPFAATVRWRADFAPQSLAGLMNRLDGYDRALLLQRERFQRQLGLEIGDEVRVETKRGELSFVIAGWLDALPTHYPDSGPFGLANLGYVVSTLGASPWDVLARLRPGVVATDLVEPLRAAGLLVQRASDVNARIAQVRTDPVQIGTFGILSLGFLGAALVTLVGFLVHAVAASRRRLAEFGMLRAMGLSAGQAVALFVFENGLVLALGALAGTALGVLTGALFIPFLRLSADRQGDIPPFVVVTAWADIGKLYIVFGVALALALPIVLILLRRIRTHEALKFGEETA